MANYTPLTVKNSKKKTPNKLFIFLNIFTVVVLTFITGYYLKDKLISKNGKATCAPTQCNLGAHSCQEDASGQNTGYNCTCVDLSDATCPNSRVWNCSNYDTNACPAPNGSGGGTLPGNCTRIGNCLKLPAGERANAWHYFCPDMTTSSNTSGGCQLNGELVQNVNEVCFSHTCGTEQIDFQGASCSFGSRVGTTACGTSTGTTTTNDTPTPTPTGTTTTVTPTELTPTEEITPTEGITNTPTEVPTGTETPTPTGTLTPTPTGTLTPTATPTGTRTPTPTPTTVTSLPSTGQLTPFAFIVPLGIIIAGLLL